MPVGEAMTNTSEVSEGQPRASGEDRQRSLANASLAVTRAEGLRDALQIVTEHARVLIGAHQAVASLTHKGDWAQTISHISLSEKYAAWREYGTEPDGSGIYAEVCARNQTMRFTQAELESHPAWRSFGSHASQHPPMRGWLAAPLIARDGSNIGLIQLSDKEAGEFTEEDEAILVQFAQMAAAAVENIRLREALAEREALLALVSNRLPACVSYIDSEERYRFVNGTYREWFGIEPSQIIGRQMRELLGDAVYETRRAPVLTALRGESVRFVAPTRIADGRIIESEIVYIPDVDASGRVRGFVGMIRDITEQMAAEEALRRSEASLRRFIDTANEGILRLGPDDRVTYSNDYHARLLGYEPGETLGMHVLDFVFPEDREQAAARRAMRREGRSERYESRLRCKDGGEVWVLNSTVVVEGSGGYDGTYSMITDITDLKRAERAIRESEARYRELSEQLEERVRDRTAELEAANREMEGFTYSVSHDLRAPLRAVISTSQILMEDYGEVLPADACDLLQRQTTAAKRLGTLIDELLRLSRVSREPVRRERIDITSMAEEIVAELGSSTPLACQVVVAPSLQAFGDSRLIRLVMLNLIDNAVKFSPEGGTVRVGSEDSAIFVADEGIGFDMQYEPKLWQPFERLVSDSQFPGTGIGLANVRRIVDRHGGRVWADSSPGQGATFSFVL